MVVDVVVVEVVVVETDDPGMTVTVEIPVPTVPSESVTCTQ